MVKYFSAFSGIGGFELAVPSKWKCIGYSEIDKYALAIYEKNFPEHASFGDITKIDIDSLPDFDLLVGGPPCQDLSAASKKQKGLEGDRSKLFYNFVDILREKKPRYFLLENVASMSKESREIISKVLSVEPVLINASLVSAQNRPRLFWCNWGVSQPVNRGIIIKNILEDGLDYPGTRSDGPVVVFNIYKSMGQNGMVYDVNGKTKTLSAGVGIIGRGIGSSNAPKIATSIEKREWRRLTPLECERLQTFPDGFTKEVSNTQRYKTLGNAVCVEVVKHIFRCLESKLRKVS